MHPDFECVRCGYSTYKKSSIKSHFERKKGCRPILNDFELTKDIKTYILQHYVYPTALHQPTTTLAKIMNTTNTKNKNNNNNNNINYNITINNLKNMTIATK
jgi:hypothetical protein